MAPFDVELHGGYRLTVAMALDADLAADYYRFNLTRGAVLVWRHDRHAGHEAEHGSRAHLHLGPRPDIRHAHPPVTLSEVIELVHATLRGETVGP